MESDSFKEHIDRLLKSIGRTFRGIHLCCTKCGDEAFAATPEAAKMFGWSKVSQVQGSNYEGICIECNASHETKGTERTDPS